MKRVLQNIYHSFPVQLFILHFRKVQVLLLFWYLLGSTINSGFMKTYGADGLFFSPEYLGNVNIWSGAIVGMALGVFIMSWNITTFILHSKRCRFLATTTQPFLKYCLNNSILPILFIGFYFYKLYVFDRTKELMRTEEILILIGGIILGFIVLLLISFLYFFGAEKKIQRTITPIIEMDKHFSQGYSPHYPDHDFGLKVTTYLGKGFRFRHTRNIAHYDRNFLDLVFTRHHFSGIICIALAFVFLILVGFYMDSPFFQVPAAASIFVFFAAMMAVIGAFSYFLQSWSLPVFIVFVFLLDILYQQEIIDPRNKAYGLNYSNRSERPGYDKISLQQLCAPGNLKADSANMIRILENWKRKQGEDKPVMIFINVSGGGLRSGTFVMNSLQHLDSMTGGKLMQHTMLISGASGGMLAATYYRELYRRQLSDSSVNRNDPRYTDNIANDLLNPLFSSMVARDIFSPAQKFQVGEYSYVKDRGYAFEQKLDRNTAHLLGGQLKEYISDEQQARIPLMIFNSTIAQDGRRMMISTQPLRFMMKPAKDAGDTATSPDAVDFASYFAKQGPLNVRLLTALRMNATFPYVLPNVWLPTNPVIDVMDAGLRDNFGQETALRFIDYFQDWLKENTSAVVLIQLRDRMQDNWQEPYQTGSVSDFLIKPATMLQHNWQKLQDYSATDQFSYLEANTTLNLHRVVFMYVPQSEQKSAALNFHLTAAEKRDVKASFRHSFNQASQKKVLQFLR